jgi:hypothetical protein
VEAAHARAPARRLWVGRGKHARDLAKLGASGADDSGGSVEALARFAGGERKARLRFGAAAMAESVTRAGERVAFAMDESFDFKSGFDIAAAIKALAGAALVRLQLRELGFPEAEHVGFDFADTGNISDLEVETIGDRRCFQDALLGELRGHSMCGRASSCVRLVTRSIGHDFRSL